MKWAGLTLALLLGVSVSISYLAYQPTAVIGGSHVFVAHIYQDSYWVWEMGSDQFLLSFSHPNDTAWTVGYESGGHNYTGQAVNAFNISEENGKIVFGQLGGTTANLTFQIQENRTWIRVRVARGQIEYSWNSSSWDNVTWQEKSYVVNDTTPPSIELDEPFQLDEFVYLSAWIYDYSYYLASLAYEIVYENGTPIDMLHEWTGENHYLPNQTTLRVEGKFARESWGDGNQSARIVATDAGGNSANQTWWFEIPEFTLFPFENPPQKGKTYTRSPPSDSHHGLGVNLLNWGGRSPRTSPGTSGTPEP